MSRNQNLAKSQLFTREAGTITGSREFRDFELYANLENGQVIDQRYRVRELIGTGGMGAVYRAYQIQLDKDVALKTLLTHSMKESAWNKFQNESKILARLQHPNVVKVLDCGIAEDGLPFYTMELLKGSSLSEKIEMGVIDVRTAVKIFIQVSQGLAAAHDKGIVHRDIKPANIFLEDIPAKGKDETRVKIIDFGIASMIVALQDRELQSSSGTLFGSPLYMSPEQCRGDSLTRATDIYSCGCALFETLTGRPPFVGDTALATIYLHLTSPPPELNSILNDAVPQRLNNLLNAMLAKEIKNRPRSFHAIADELSSVLQVILTGSPATSAGLYTAISINDDNNGELDQLEPLETDPSRQIPIYLAAALVLLGACLLPLLFSTSPSSRSVIQSTTKSKTFLGSNTEIQNSLKVTDSLLENPHAKVLTQKPAAEAYLEPLEKNVVPTRSLNDKTPYCTLVEGGAMRKFHWPEDFVIGAVANSDLNFRDASGTFFSSTKENMFFRPSPFLVEYPQYIKRFRPGDVTSVCLNEKNGTNEMLAFMSELPAVVHLDLDACSHLNADSLQLLRKYPFLHRLSFGNCGFAPADVSRLSDLNRFDWIACMDDRSNDHLLAQLAKCKKLVYLNLDGSSITGEGFRNISKQAQLRTLSLQKSKFDTTDLGKLSACPRLSTIYMTSRTIDPQTIAQLQKVRGLRCLRLSRSKYQNVSARSIKQALPNVELTEQEFD